LADPLFITLEGGEGAGKSTQARQLAKALAESGRPVLLTREPGGAPGAHFLRKLLLDGTYNWSAAAEAHLFFAARAEHCAKTIIPALAAGMTVVCDRFADSTLAYQAYGLGADPALIEGLTRLLPRLPDRTIILTVDAATARERVLARAKPLDHYETLSAEFHARVAEGFAAIARAAPQRCRVVDANGSIEGVHHAIMAALA